MVVRHIQKLLELSIRDRILIDVKRFYAHGMLMETARGILPRILDVNTNIVRSFDFYSTHSEEKIRFRNLNHSHGSTANRACCSDRRDLLFQDLTLARKTGERSGGPLLRLRHQPLDFRIGFGAGSENGSETIAFDRKTQNRSSGRVFLHL